MVQISLYTAQLYGYAEHVSESQSSRGSFEKVGECLYRLSSNGRYYARVWSAGKEIRRSLRTNDRELAKRLLGALRKDLEHLDTTVSQKKLSELVELYLTTIQGKSKGTKDREEMVVKRMREDWPGGLNVRVCDVKPSDVLGFMSIQRDRYAATSYNAFVNSMRKLFDLAIADRIIITSPVEGLKRAKVDTPIRDTPNWEQFKAIVADMRTQKYNADASDSANFCEFLGLAGMGNSEAANLTWGDIDFKKERVRVYRNKTDTGFMIPIYPQLRPLLDAMRGDGERSPDERIFIVYDIRKSLGNACKRLKLPHFTQRSLRRCFITRAVELGIDFKTIAAMQGHRDGGVLIAKTYSHLRTEHLDRMAEKLAE